MQQCFCAVAFSAHRTYVATFSLTQLVVLAGSPRSPRARRNHQQRQHQSPCGFTAAARRRCTAARVGEHGRLGRDRPNSHLGRCPAPGREGGSRPRHHRSPRPASAKKMSSATGGRAPLLSREEGSSLAVGTTPGGGASLGPPGEATHSQITHERGASW